MLYSILFHAIVLVVENNIVHFGHLIARLPLIYIL